ncbi:hypothetical protein DVH24_006104 [Malus domestica]|uniref:Uncharacterized protein n=1 Tax=Malus domestica TaxID=3750 RepID=A0A498J1J8_MALDO|nr:hypothetical protein DVH24_006104 [Malus domestica]
MDFYVVLERPGYRVGRRRRCKSRVGIQHRVTKDDAMKWFQVKYEGCTRLPLYAGSGRGECRLALPPFMERLLPSLEPETYSSWAKALAIAPRFRALRMLIAMPENTTKPAVLATELSLELPLELPLPAVELGSDIDGWWDLESN